VDRRDTYIFHPASLTLSHTAGAVDIMFTVHFGGNGGGFGGGIGSSVDQVDELIEQLD